MNALHLVKATRVCFILLFFLHPSINSSAQVLQKDPDKYFIGDSEKLEIIVHVWGQVRTPGRYVVEDGTDILELISLAGGPTQYSNLAKVKLTRGEYFSKDTVERIASDSSHSVVQVDQNSIVNLEKYLDDNEGHVPVLGPGDVVRVPKNSWFGFEAVVRIVAQLAIVAQVYYWYSRSY